ncbi:hypothetical protein [Aquimarina spongiae]|uniref:M penetrans paralogue family 26 n=1 Tax=Aquimarina spongiae TaxID=570521 RepID=A0A1M6CQ76_9FLAO|nr:hypothetical protein [Aquimarina spongiae]SHI62944.1 M penetrans paralogue family 26 [Aquimarina spongiae]
MDELELLKKDWKKQDTAMPRLSYNEIYKMILKKSSSMVKWIFIISLLEFSLWVLLDIFLRVNGYTEQEQVDELLSGGFIVGLSLVYYAVIVFFVVRFYLNYKKIQTTDSAKVLMENIFRTRKTVKYYVWFNIGFFALTFMSFTIYLAAFTDHYQKQADLGQASTTIIIVSSIILGLIFIGFIALFYRVIYGIITRRLKRNYNELEKLEV